MLNLILKNLRFIFENCRSFQYFSLDYAYHLDYVPYFPVNFDGQPSTKFTLNPKMIYENNLSPKCHIQGWISRYTSALYLEPVARYTLGVYPRGMA